MACTRRWAGRWAWLRWAEDAEAHRSQVVIQDLGGLHPHGLDGTGGRQRTDATVADAVVERNPTLHGVGNNDKGTNSNRIVLFEKG